MCPHNNISTYCPSCLKMNIDSPAWLSPLGNTGFSGKYGMGDGTVSALSSISDASGAIAAAPEAAPCQPGFQSFVNENSDGSYTQQCVSLTAPAPVTATAPVYTCYAEVTATGIVGYSATPTTGDSVGQPCYQSVSGDASSPTITYTPVSGTGPTLYSTTPSATPTIVSSAPVSTAQAIVASAPVGASVTPPQAVTVTSPSNSLLQKISSFYSSNPTAAIAIAAAAVFLVMLILKDKSHA
jgi:hypothetical protein